MVEAHLGASTRTAHAMKAGVDSTKAASQAQAAWRFLNNENVSLPALAEPLQQAAREGCAASDSPFVLIMHDWCKLSYQKHTSKEDACQVTHEHDIGYDLTTSLAVEADHGSPLAPVAMHLRAKRQVHSTLAKPPRKNTKHLDQLAPTMEAIDQLALGRRPVHIIDREADSLGHFRDWSAAEHLFLVRCDERRVSWQGKSVLLSEINAALDRQFRFKKAGEARYRGKKVRREVAEVTVVLDRIHKTRVNGKQKEVRGEPITLRAVFVRLVDEKGYIVAEWMLLTNVPADQANAKTIGKWYYYRWRIESFFKLLKSAGHELERWQQTTGAAIARRLLVASMACVYVWRLQRDRSDSATAMRAHLMKLSGRQTKHGVESTASALLAGWYTLMSVLTLAETVPLADLRRLAAQCSPPHF
jgi:hypothetical protein